jgi:hypothetical protein
MSWCQMLSTVRADDLQRISRHRTTNLRCRREARWHASVRAALEDQESVGACYEKTANLAAEIAAAASKG